MRERPDPPTPRAPDRLGHSARAERKPRRVLLVHGDPEALEALEPRVRALSLETRRPVWREEVELH